MEHRRFSPKDSANEAQTQRAALKSETSPQPLSNRGRILPTLALLGALTVPLATEAHDMKYPELAGWMGRLGFNIPGTDYYIPCCNGTDCHVIDDGQSAWQDPETNEWKVIADPKFFPKGDGKIYTVNPYVKTYELQGGQYERATNPSGLPVACWYPGLRQIDCFIQPPDS